MEPRYKVNTRRDTLQPGEDIYAKLISAALAKWQGDTLARSELVAWIRSTPLDPETGTRLIPPQPTVEAADALAEQLISMQYFTVVHDG